MKKRNLSDRSFAHQKKMVCWLAPWELAHIQVKWILTGPCKKNECNVGILQASPKYRGRFLSQEGLRNTLNPWPLYQKSHALTDSSQVPNVLDWPV